MFRQKFIHFADKLSNDYAFRAIIGAGTVGCFGAPYGVLKAPAGMSSVEYAGIFLINGSACCVIGGLAALCPLQVAIPTVGLMAATIAWKRRLDTNDPRKRGPKLNDC